MEVPGGLGTLTGVHAHAAQHGVDLVTDVSHNPCPVLGDHLVDRCTEIVVCAERRYVYFCTIDFIFLFLGVFCHLI